MKAEFEFPEFNPSICRERTIESNSICGHDNGRSQTQILACLTLRIELAVRPSKTLRFVESLNVVHHDFIAIR
jgi:hypothetical protein